MLLSRHLINLPKVNALNLIDLPTYKLIETLKLATFGAGGGLPTLSNVATIICNNIEATFRRTLTEKLDIPEWTFPSLCSVSLLEASGRFEKFKNQIYKLDSSNLIATPALEEIVAQHFAEHVKSARALPRYTFEINKRFRRVVSKRGINRLKAFTMIDAYGVHATRSGALQSFEDILPFCRMVFNELDLTILEARRANEPYILFLNSSPEGEHYVAKCEQGHAQEGFMTVDAGYTCSVCGAKPQKGRGFGVGMFEICDPEPIVAANFKVAMPGGERKYPVLATYSFGTLRLFYAVVDQHRDAHGIIFPKNLYPYKMTIIPTRCDDELLNAQALSLYRMLNQAGIQAIFDDRESVSVHEKRSYSDIFGVSEKVVVGQNSDGVVYFEREMRGESIRVATSISEILSTYSKGS